MSKPAKRPNFLVILADDLGFSDLGCYGGEIRTPNLDKLASQGVRFTNFHTASACSPTRSMLLSGTDNHIAGIGAMVEHHIDPGAERWIGKPGHEGYLVDSVAALPEVLQDAGYHTIMSGKWHLGREPGTIPADRGFDRSYAFLHGCHNHYAWEPQFEGSEKDKNKILNWCAGMATKHHMYARDKEYFTPKANLPKQDGGFYSTDTFTDELLQYLDERQKTPDLQGKPFFAYYTFTAPHWPLQAPKEFRDHYKGMYDDGPAALRDRRLANLEKMGLIDPGAQAHPLINPQKVPEWDAMSDQERAMSARAVETYAAMVEMIDVNVGRVVDQLEKDGELDNTFILFMSDNGAEGASYEMIPYLGASLATVINTYYNNDLENIGEPDSFAWYGSLWAQAATAPGRLYKMWTAEGGIRVPFIMRYPPLHNQPHLRPGSISHSFATVMDLMPTFLDLSGTPHPNKTFKGRDVVPIRGTSWLDWFNRRGEAGKDGEIHHDDAPVGWELHGRAALKMGDWKILFLPPPYGKGDWELYNLKTDPGETTDLSTKEPEKFELLKAAWEKYVAESQVVWGDPMYTGQLVQVDETEDPKSWMAYAINKSKAA